jgi:hypothetical protein
MSDEALFWLTLIAAIVVDGWLIYMRHGSRRANPLGKVHNTILVRYPRTIAARLPEYLSALRRLPQLKFAATITTSLEWLVLVVVVFAYASQLLSTHPNLSITGKEFETHAARMSLFIEWFVQGADFPLWNPVMGFGRSLIADPFLFIFNPFASLPMLILGVLNGAQLAVFINFIIAATGVWTIGKLLGFHWPVRLWSSLMYMMSGALAGHLTIGQIQLTFALGWLPWSLAGVLAVIKHPSRRTLAAASLAQACFFFCGNLYYQAYASMCFLIIVIAYGVEWRSLRLNRKVITYIPLLALLSLGLIAIQFLPQLASLPSIRNFGGYAPDDAEFFGSQLPEHALLNYVVSDYEFATSATLGKVPFLQESYRYIGLSPFVLLLFIVPAFRGERRREIIVFAACFLLMLAWTGLRYTFVQDLYRAFPILHQFRWPGRALSVGGLFIILLGGYGLNWLWEWATANRSRWSLRDRRGARMLNLPPRLALATFVLVGIVMSVQHLFKTNSVYVYLDRYEEPYVGEGLAWLRSQDTDEYAVGNSPGIASDYALEAYQLHLRFLHITDGWAPAPPPATLGPAFVLRLQPRYWAIWEIEKLIEKQAQFVRQFGGMQIWRIPDAFPYAFTLPADRLYEDAPEIDPSEVEPAANVQRAWPNRIAVETQVDRASVLVLSESWFVGWNVWIDEQPAPLESVSGYIAVHLEPGRHSVRFAYDPPAFKIGALISAVTFVVTLMFLVIRRA